MEEKDDLGEVIRSERRRGKRPVDEAQIKARRSLERAWLTFLLEGTEEQVRRAIRDHLGLREDSERFCEILSEWISYRKGFERRRQKR